jgi:hypothetical protein
MKRLVVALALASAGLCIGAAEDSKWRPASSSVYKRIASPRVELEVPVGWRVATSSELAELAKEHSGQARPQVRYELMASVPRAGTGAIVIVRTREPGIWPTKTLSKVNEHELRHMGLQMGKEFRGKPSPSGLGLLADSPDYRVLDLTVGAVQVRALFVSYLEDNKSVDEKGQRVRWKTHQLYIPRDGYEVELAMSFHEQDEQQWWPVMRHVMRTLQY